MDWMLFSKEPPKGFYKPQQETPFLCLKINLSFEQNVSYFGMSHGLRLHNNARMPTTHSGKHHVCKRYLYSSTLPSPLLPEPTCSRVLWRTERDTELTSLSEDQRGHSGNVARLKNGQWRRGLLRGS